MSKPIRSAEQTARLYALCSPRCHIHGDLPKHLGPKGKAMPENVLPGQEPKAQHIVMTPQNTGATPAADT